MALTVTRIRMRSTGATDRYGKPILGIITTEHKAWAFAPSPASERDEVGRTTAESGGTLYFRAPNFCDAEPADVFVVGGTKYRVEGPSAHWQHLDAADRGDVVVLRRTETVNG